MGILKKHQANNYYDRTFSDFIERLENGRIGVAMLNHWDLYGSRCVDCDEPTTAFKGYPGRRYDLTEVGAMWVIHQCPPPTEPVYPDDPNVRDGDGNIRADDWSDDQDRRHDQDYPDPVYGYPDIPYVDPT